MANFDHLNSLWRHAVSISLSAALGQATSGITGEGNSHKSGLICQE
jgi:hypothetical protein